jgi:hypothetical protein
LSTEYFPLIEDFSTQQIIYWLLHSISFHFNFENFDLREFTIVLSESTSSFEINFFVTSFVFQVSSFSSFVFREIYQTSLS